MTENFIKAFDELIGFEGGYVNDPRDPGGETYMGISRRYNPQWPGWARIDELKSRYGADKRVLNSDNELHRMAEEFYYENYWRRFNGDRLPYILAEELLEQSVILGTWKTAGKNLQRALNLLNRNGELFPDLEIDGYVGPKTIEAVKRVNLRRLLTVLNGLEFERFKDSMIKNPGKEVYVGWFDRVNLG